MRIVTRTLAGLGLALAMTSAALSARAEGDGLAASADRVPWARFQGRIAYSAAPAWQTDLAPSTGNGLKVSSVSVMGDVYFNADSARSGGFRATSGVLVGSRSTLWGTSATALGTTSLNVDRRLFGPSGLLPGTNDASIDNSTLPYLGVGYSSLAGHGGWSFSADLGVVSLSPSNASRIGRVFGGGQSLDDVVRDMRLAPVLQFGVSYSF